MFLKSKIRKLRTDIQVKEERVRLIKIADKQCSTFYYTNQIIEESCKLTEMRLRLVGLELKLNPENSNG